MSPTDTISESYLNYFYFSFFSIRGAPLESNKSDYCSVTLRSFLRLFGGSLGGDGNGLLNISEVAQETSSRKIFSKEELFFGSTVGDLSRGVF